jgi:hypothetical protein
VHALRRPLEFCDAFRDWSRRTIFLLVVLLALAALLLALVTRDLVVPAVRSAVATPAAPLTPFCDRSPFSLDEELFICAPAGTPLPPWSRQENPVEHSVELATFIDKAITHTWSGAWSFVEPFALELGSLLSRPAWSTLEALEQPGDPTEAWMLPPRSVPQQVTPPS